MLSYIFFISCKSDDSSIEDFSAPDFEQTVTGTLLNSDISEISGIAPSYKNPGKYWVHNDSGDKPRVFLIDSTGYVHATITLAKIENRDWEDIATYKDPASGNSFVYLADIGDNFKQFDYKYIYKFEEPGISENLENLAISNVEKITFKYADGKKDAETLLADPLTGDIFIISKWEQAVDLYHLSNINWGDTISLEKSATLAFSGATGGDISEDGLEILIKTYNKIYYWKRTNKEPIPSVLNKPSNELAYTAEPQGEAICWTLKGKDFITVSECIPLHDCDVNFFKRR